MLVLQRKENQPLVIFPSENISPDMTVAELFKDGSIEIHVTDSKANSVRLGLSLPDELIALRSELLPD